MCMNGVTFGSKHSYDDFGLILSSKEIAFPEPKTETVSVPGHDGDIDLTEALSDNVTFENRELKFTFTLLNALKNWATTLTAVANYLHGQKMKIIMDADAGYYYYGRCTVDQYQSNQTLGTIVVKCDVEPYKSDVNAPGDDWLWDPFSFVDGIIYTTSVTLSYTGTVVEVNLVNRRKVVSPTFTCTQAITVTYDGTEYILSAGTTTLYDIRLQEGDNYITMCSNGATSVVTITYKVGTF